MSISCMNDIPSVIVMNVYYYILFFNSEAISCLRPQLIDDQLSITPPKKSYAYNEVINFSCSDGYNLVGSPSTICNNSEHFRDGFPNCRGKIVYYLV